VCAVRQSGGTAACWGWNMWNQVDESATTEITTPDPIAAPATGWTMVLAGGEYYAQTCGLVGDAAYCWGNGQDGRLGLGDTSGEAAPAPLTTPAATGWEAISPGGGHGCALRAGGQLYCWGGIFTTPLGNGRIEGSTLPVRVGTGAGWKQVETGAFHSCAIDADDALWCWGDNSGLQLGSGVGLSAAPLPVTAVPSP
jgi:alpha-tubulin suppressor-like RCC1 family protein